MFESSGSEPDNDRSTTDQPGTPGLTTARLAALIGAMAGLDPTVADVELIDRIGLLERVKSAAAAAQARHTTAFVSSQRAAQRAAGTPERQVGLGIAAQIGLARRVSAARATRDTGFAQVLIGELRHTYTALQRGHTTEWRAMIVARETAWLSRTDRATVDAALADQLPGLGDRGVETETKKLAYRLDPHGYLEHTRRVQRDRRVTCRPAPDTMAYLTALLPVTEAVATHTTLTRAADALRAAGDPRTRSQLMSDLLVERVTGQTTATAVPVEIHLVMTDHTLFNHENEHDHGDQHDSDDEQSAQPTEQDGGPDEATEQPEYAEPAEHTVDKDQAGSGDPDHDVVRADPYGDHDEPDQPNETVETVETVEHAYDAGGDAVAGADDDPADGTVDPDEVARALRDAGPDEPAHLIGYGPIPAGLARRLIRDADPSTTIWVRRLYTNPHTGQIVTGDTRWRLFTGQLRQLLVLRDQTCRTPWCGAPIRHTDHSLAAATGGATSLANGQGLCAACNYTKQAPGWQARPGPAGTSDTITITTPTGHTYPSRAPQPPGSRSRSSPAGQRGRTPQTLADTLASGAHSERVA